MFGHTHRQIVGIVAGVPVVNVSLGYAREISEGGIGRLVKLAIIDTSSPKWFEG